jgi:serine/threonine protein kinase
MHVRTRFDHYELLEFIASGGMGTVYKARDLNLNRILALKLLRKEFSSDAEYIEKLETEAKITASVTHPNVVEVFSFGSDQGVYYIAMELVDKGSLDDLMTLQQRIAEAQVLQIGSQVAQGLRAAYQAGLIHRDVKPGNILFADAHTAKIVDFGLAMPLEQAQEGEEDIWGTPYYVAPEKLNHEPEDFRSDIYSLGGTLFHALAGRPPFEAENASLVALKHLKSQVVSLQAFAPDISSPTAYVINRTLAKNPDDRYQSYDELIEHLEYARAQLLENAGSARQPKTRVVMEDEKQQNVMGYIMMGMLAFTLVIGVILYLFRDSILSRNSSVEELARQQMERSANSGEQALAAVRKVIIKGDYAEAYKMLQPMGTRPNLTEPFKTWIALHQCIAHLLAGEFWSVPSLVAGLQDDSTARGKEAVDDGQRRQFFNTLKGLMSSR